MTAVGTENEHVYLDLLRDVLANGEEQADRTGVGTLSVFGRQCRYNLKTDFPLLTTKKLMFSSISSELLWFIEGSGDERRLAEIRYGKPRQELVGKNTIWTENAEANYWKPKAKFEGDLGRVYGVQWRSWQTPMHYQYHQIGTKTTDQLAQLIEGIKKDPNGRRHILLGWNPGELDQMALPPCHLMCQFKVTKGRLSCMLNIRSNDLFLGAPYNIASYALFTMMIAHVTGYEADELIVTIGDAHIYKNHLEQVEEQLSRTPRAAPFVTLDRSVTNIDDFNMQSFKVWEYNPLEAIKAEMAV